MIAIDLGEGAFAQETSEITSSNIRRKYIL